MSASTTSAPGGSSSRSSKTCSPFSGERQAADARAADLVGARLAGAHGGVDLDARDPVGRHAGAEAAHPVERRSGTLLGAEHRAVRGQEADLDARPPSATGMRVLARTPAACSTRPDVERLAEAIQRRDGVRRVDRGAAAAERARGRRVGADHGDAPELAGVERQGVISRCARARSPRTPRAAARPPPRRRRRRARAPPRCPRARPPARRGAGCAAPCRRSSPRRPRPPGPRPRARRATGSRARASPGRAPRGRSRPSSGWRTSPTSRAPSKPHSSCRISRSSGLSVMVCPLTPL